MRIGPWPLDEASGLGLGAVVEAVLEATIGNLSVFDSVGLGGIPAYLGEDVAQLRDSGNGVVHIDAAGIPIESMLAGEGARLPPRTKTSASTQWPSLRVHCEAMPGRRRRRQRYATSAPQCLRQASSIGVGVTRCDWARNLLRGPRSEECLRFCRTSAEGWPCCAGRGPQARRLIIK